MEHTPIPWRAKAQALGGAQIWAERVGVAFTFAGDDQPSEANAAFIVRAVNNHAKLLEALERAQWLIHEDLCPATEDIEDCLSVVCVAARAVIEEARK